MAELNELVAVVTGGTSGIGKAIAKALGEKGARLAVIGRNEEKGAKAAAELNEVTECGFFRCDVADLEGINAAFEAILERFGAADILVNAAGIPVRDYIEDITPERWDEFMNANVRSVFFFSQLFGEHIRERESGYGRIINISSVRSEIYDDFHTGYSLSKAAIDSLTKAFAVCYAEDGVTTNAIAPGFVETEMTDHYNIGDAKIESIMKSLSPIHRNIKAAEIASLAAFLCERGAAAVNGQLIKADGGGTSSPGMYY